MNKPVTLSEELERLSAEFEPFEKSGILLTGGEVCRLRIRLSVFARAARNQEQELSVHRLIEANRRIAKEIETISAEARSNLEQFRDDNVIRPEFSGGHKP